MPEIVGLTIDGKQFAYWSDVTIQLAIDNHPTVSLVAPFEAGRALPVAGFVSSPGANRAEFRSLFRPFSYAPLTVTVDDELVFTGTMIDVNPSVSAAARTVEVTAYSRAAKLSECDMPWDSVPFECDGLKLDAIAQHFCKPFGLRAKIAPEDSRSAFGGDPGAAFSRVKPTKRTKKRNKVFGGEGQETLQVEGNVQEFLANLGRQRGFVLSSDENGDLLFRRSATPGRPVAMFEEGLQPALVFTPQFNPREFYSEITGVTPAKNKRKGSSYTLKNPFLTGERRSMSFNLDDTEAADAPTAVRAAMGRMFANVMNLSITVPTWRDPSGALWAPNTTVTALAPNAMVYKETEFLIREVLLNQNSEQEIAQLTLVLPGAFSGELPDTLPWLE